MVHILLSLPFPSLFFSFSLFFFPLSAFLSLVDAGGRTERERERERFNQLKTTNQINGTGHCTEYCIYLLVQLLVCIGQHALYDDMT